MPLADVVSPAVRSKMMRNIKGKNTTPELIIRRGLHARGFRFRLHVSDVPGKPDLVLPRHRVVIFIHGCFWHSHGCPLFKMPTTRPEFWRKKLSRNKARDLKVRSAVKDAGWRQLIIWECATKGKGRIETDTLLSGVAHWINGLETEGEITGGLTMGPVTASEPE